MTRGTSPAPLCLAHREAPVVAVCARCGAGLCDECWTFVAGGAPSCVVCVRDVEWPEKRAWSRFAVFVLVAAGLGYWLSRHVPSDVAAGAWFALGIAAIVFVFYTVAGVRSAREHTKGIERREPGGPSLANERDPLRPAAHPYRTRLARATRNAVPALSAYTTTFVVGFALVTSGVLLPVALKLPRWIEMELVLGVWWALLVVFLAVMLHSGARIKEDHAFVMRWNLGSKSETKQSKSPPSGGSSSGGSSSGSSWWSNIGDGCGDAEGCVGIVLGVVLVGAALAASWLLVELALPVLFFLLYWLVLKAIARVTNDRHGCEGSVPRARGWGALWATVYTIPLGLGGWGVHQIVAVPSSR